eukprot:RCo043444
MTPPAVIEADTPSVPVTAPRTCRSSAHHVHHPAPGGLDGNPVAAAMEFAVAVASAKTLGVKEHLRAQWIREGVCTTGWGGGREPGDPATPRGREPAARITSGRVGGLEGPRVRLWTSLCSSYRSSNPWIIPKPSPSPRRAPPTAGSNVSRSIPNTKGLLRIPVRAPPAAQTQAMEKTGRKAGMVGGERRALRSPARAGIGLAAGEDGKIRRCGRVEIGPLPLLCPLRRRGERSKGVGYPPPSPGLRASTPVDLAAAQPSQELTPEEPRVRFFRSQWAGSATESTHNEEGCTGKQGRLRGKFISQILARGGMAWQQ